jgi:hypothetical protein
MRPLVALHARWSHFKRPRWGHCKCQETDLGGSVCSIQQQLNQAPPARLGIAGGPAHERMSSMGNANAIEPRFVGSIWPNQRRGPRVAVYSAGPDPAVILDITSRACTTRLGLTAAEARHFASLIYVATIGKEDDDDS